MKKIVIIISIIIVNVTAQAQIRTGAMCMERYLPLLEDKRVAVCANQTSMVENSHLVDTLLSLNVRLKKIFCPEHGFRGKAEAGAHIASSVDKKSGLPIISLYGKNRKPLANQINDLDVILFDLQDVGCRFYTYISTLHYVMEAAAENNVQVVVLDRPNPNGYFVDGPVLDTTFRSFVGMHPVPVVYGLTIGEYAQMINGEGWLNADNKCDLVVIRLENYTHTMRYNLPVAPSPNLSNAEAIYLYPSLCFFEGTAISVGRGTAAPFQIFGAPELNAGDFYFTPTPITGVSENPPCKNQQCRGYNLYEAAHDRLYKNNSVNIDYLITAYNNYANRTQFFTNSSFFDKLAGTSQLRKDIIAGKSADEIRASWQQGINEYKKVRSQYLLYTDFEVGE